MPSLFKWLASLFQEPECNHIYFPVMVGDKPIGQQCRLCGKFNSLRQLGMDDKKGPEG